MVLGAHNDPGGLSASFPSLLGGERPRGRREVEAGAAGAGTKPSGLSGGAAGMSSAQVHGCMH